MTLAPSLCRDCQAPIDWKDTDQGRRPFDANGRSHFQTCSARPARRTGKPQTDSRTIARLAVLKAAANFAATRDEIKSADVLKIAAAWLAWVEAE